MRIKNWSKESDNSWKLNKKPKGYAHTIIFVRKGTSGDYLVGSEHSILKRVKTKGEVYKEAVKWMRKHPNG